MTELERMNQAEGYINRYFEFEDGVTVSQENKEYLKTYIRDINDVETEFNFKSKFLRGLGISGGIALALFILLVIPLHSGMLILVPIIAFAAALIAGTVFFYSLTKYKLDAAKEHQKEVNEGITEQIEILDLRIQQLEKQRDDYLAALAQRIDFMDIDLEFMRNFSKIKEFLENGSAETCEDAVYMYEQIALMNQMNSIMTASEHKPETDREKNIERFGDPLKIIKENKKKKKKEKKKK